jgi:hypothetical protein
MELTVRRSAGIALAGFALLVLARPPRPVGPTFDELVARLRTPAEQAGRAHQAVSDSLQAVEYSLWSRQLRDSVERELQRVPSAARDRLFLDPRIPPSFRRHLETVYAATRARMPKTKLALPIVVMLDEQSAWQGTRLWFGETKGLPDACVTVIRAGVSRAALDDGVLLVGQLRRSLPPTFPQASHLGLCGFEAVFGPPSAAVRRWLHERDYQPIASGYDVATPHREPPRVAEGYMPYFYATSNAEQALLQHACAAGRTAMCLGAVAPPSVKPRGDIADPASARLWLGWRWYSWRWPGSSVLMNTVAQSLGAQRFAELWRGAEAPPEAYRRLTGVPIDSLARRVLAGNAPPMRAGAAITPRGVILSLLIAGVLLALAMRSHPRRRRA